jgi:tRNA(Ile)-lysidine synthase
MGNRPPSTTEDSLTSHPGQNRRLGQSQLVRHVEQALMTAGIQRGARLVLGCSGGPDSTALLLALWLGRARHAWQVQVVCVDHGLREAAKQEARLVESVGARLGFSVRLMTVEVPQQASLQAAAREARYQALTAAAEAWGGEAVLVAHTADDQAETILQRLLGGAGPRGLSGMPAQRWLTAGNGEQPVRPVRLLRPLLALTRTEVLEFLALAGPLAAPLPLFDPSNDDLRFARARVRHQLLPQLQTLQPGPGLVPHLLSLAEQLREDSNYLDELATEQLARITIGEEPLLPGQVAAISVSRLRALPRPIATRLLARLVPGPLSRLHLLALHQLCAHSRGSQSIDLPAGLLAERRYDTLYLRRPPSDLPALPLMTELPTCGVYQHGQQRIRLSYLGPADVAPPRSWETPHCVVLTLPAPGFPLWLRSPRPGDRLRLGGGHRKLSDLLIDAKLPRRERAGLLLLGAGSEPLWLVGVRAATQPATCCAEGQVRIVAEVLK